MAPLDDLPSSGLWLGADSGTSGATGIAVICGDASGSIAVGGGAMPVGDAVGMMGPTIGAGAVGSSSAVTGSETVGSPVVDGAGLAVTGSTTVVPSVTGLSSHPPHDPTPHGKASSDGKLAGGYPSPSRAIELGDTSTAIGMASSWGLRWTRGPAAGRLHVGLGAPK